MWEKKNPEARVEKTLINKSANYPIKNIYVGSIYDISNVNWKKKKQLTQILQRAAIPH